VIIGKRNAVEPPASSEASAQALAATSATMPIDRAFRKRCVAGRGPEFRDKHRLPLARFPSRFQPGLAHRHPGQRCCSRCRDSASGWRLSKLSLRVSTSPFAALRIPDMASPIAA
jgi:hypothetical protein